MQNKFSIQNLKNHFYISFIRNPRTETRCLSVHVDWVQMVHGDLAQPISDESNTASNWSDKFSDKWAGCGPVTEILILYAK